jgi:putative NADH-flavin reductase
MPKFSPKEVEALLDEWAAAQSKINKLQTKCNKEMDPFVREHNERVAPIVEAFESKAQPLRQKSDEIEQAIITALMSNLDKDKNPKLVTINGAGAVAVVERKEGSRVVDVEKYFNFVKVKTKAFWDSLKVTLKNAEPLVGKDQIDKIATKPVSFQAVVKAK